MTLFPRIITPSEMRGLFFYLSWYNNNKGVFMKYNILISIDTVNKKEQMKCLFECFSGIAVRIINDRPKEKHGGAIVGFISGYKDLKTKIETCIGGYRITKGDMYEKNYSDWKKLTAKKKRSRNKNINKSS